MPFQVASMVRGSARRSRVLSFEKTCSIGLRSGEYFGRKNSLAPAARISWRTARPLWLPRLSMITMSPALRLGTRNCSTPAFAGAGGRAKAGAIDRPVDDTGRGDPIAAQGRQQGQGPPAAERHLPHHAAAPAAAPR